MTTLATDVDRTPGDDATRRPRDVVPWAVAALAVLARVPFLVRGPFTDEAGFLVVGAQWHHGGTSLYGSYWVDRPPLLISIFELASSLGGLVPLRLIGMAAVAASVLLSAGAAREVGGRRAGRVAATLVGLLLAGPLTGAIEVNGELLAAPFVAGGSWACLAAVRRPAGRRGATAAGLAGAAAVSAVLVKQNVVDVGLLAVVLLGLSWHAREVSGIDARRLAGWFVRGAAVALALVGGWTLGHGTSLTGVFDAMYPFRWQAHHVLSLAPSSHVAHRDVVLVTAALTGGSALVAATAVAGAFTRRLRHPARTALAVVVLWDVASIQLGGNSWIHYLVLLVVPGSIGAAIALAPHPLTRRVGCAALAVVTAVTWVGSLGIHQESDATRVGTAIGAVSRPGDSLVTLWGVASVNEAAGLPSPDVNLWSLPLKVHDPDLTQLDGVLRGQRAPTWVLVATSLHTWGLDTTTLRHVLAQRYTLSTTVCGHALYVRDGVDRSPPAVRCSHVPTVLSTLKAHLP